MKRLVPNRRFMKWTGLVVSTLTFGMWIVSLLWVAGYSRFRSDARFQWSVYLMNGCFKIYRTDWVSLEMHGITARNRRTGWIATPRQRAPEWSFQLDVPWSGSAFSSMYLPLWIPFLVLGVPTAWLWWRDRRVPSGHCPKCRYDRTGLAPDAACPECGSSLRRSGGM